MEEGKRYICIKDGIFFESLLHPEAIPVTKEFADLAPEELKQYIHYKYRKGIITPKVIKFGDPENPNLSFDIDRDSKFNFYWICKDHMDEYFQEFEGD